VYDGPGSIRVPQVGESFSEFGPTAEAPALDGAGGAVQGSGGLFDRPALEIDEDDGGPLVGGERVEGVADLPDRLTALNRGTWIGQARVVDEGCGTLAS
jgi:hypothetical protein